MAEVISISVDSKAAKIFNSANRKQRQMVQKLVSSLLKYGGQTSLDSHLNRMDKISEKAIAKGLTEKRLDSFLAED